MNKEINKIIEENSSPLSPFETGIKSSGKKLMEIKAIFFDIYGTLMISASGDICLSEEKGINYKITPILEKAGLQITCSQELVDDEFAYRIKRLIDESHEDLRSKGIDYPEVDIVDIWKNLIGELKDENYISGDINDGELNKAIVRRECLINPVWPMPGALSLIEDLSSRGFKLGLISNAQFYTQPLMETLFQTDLTKAGFDRELIFYSYKSRRAKPSLTFFKEAIEKMKVLYNIEADEILYIGNDMLNDIYTASTCRCRTALFAGDQRSLRLRKGDQRCRNLRADLILGKLDQLREYI